MSLLEQKYWNFHALFHHLSQFFHFVLNLILILSALFSAHQYKAFFGKSGTIFQDESYQIFLMTIWLKHFINVWKNLRFLKSKFFNSKINTKCSIWSCKSKYYLKVNFLLSYFPERLYIREVDVSALAEQNKNYFFQLWVLNCGNDQQKWGKIGNFNDFCSTELKTYVLFNGVVVGFGAKGLSGKMCDSVR